MTSSRASTQKSAPSVFDNRHASTARLCQSMIATRYRKPLRLPLLVLAFERCGAEGVARARRLRVESAAHVLRRPFGVGYRGAHRGMELPGTHEVAPGGHDPVEYRP